MKHTHVIGIDPGIVHTGVVSLEFLPSLKRITVRHTVVQGTNAHDVERWIKGLIINPSTEAIFIEGYRARSNLRHDKQMQVAVTEMVKATKGKALDNMGVKKIVKPAVLITLGAWLFSTPTHHDDLRSAARIAVLGMMKDPEMNLLLADIIRDHLGGQPWTIQIN